MKWSLILKLVTYSSRIQIIPTVNQIPNITKINVWVQSQNYSTALGGSVTLQGPSGLKLCALGCQPLPLIKDGIFWDLLSVSSYTSSTNILNSTGPSFDVWSRLLVTSHQMGVALFVLDGLAKCAAHLAVCPAQDYLASCSGGCRRQCQKHYESWVIWHAPFSPCPQSQPFHCRRQSGRPTMICLW